MFTNSKVASQFFGNPTRQYNKENGFFIVQPVDIIDVSDSLLYIMKCLLMKQYTCLQVIRRHMAYVNSSER